MASEGIDLLSLSSSLQTQQSANQSLATSFWEPLERIRLFAYECIYKEFGSCLRHLCYRGVFWMDPGIHGLNPTVIRTSHQLNQVAKVMLLLHGAHNAPSSFIPLAEKLSQAKIKNVFTVPTEQFEEDPVSIISLEARIQEITQLYLQKGYKEVDFALVGHSLGALVASKYIWRGVHVIDHAKISMMIAIAGRLKYASNPFSWFCKDVKPEIKETYRAMSEDLGKVKTVYDLGGSRCCGAFRVSPFSAKSESRVYCRRVGA